VWREGKSAAECGCGVDSELPGAPFAEKQTVQIISIVTISSTA
jgi:hypothetical protein